MWRRATKLASSRRLRIFSQSSSVSPAPHRASTAHEGSSIFDETAHFQRNPFVASAGFETLPSADPFRISSYFASLRYYATAAAEALVSTSSEDDEEVRELVQEIKKHQKRESAASSKPRESARQLGGMGQWKYNALRRRQVKVETEAWEQAAKEYQELLADMCEQKLAPNLPYMKSLFLGWFQPLRDAIAAEQEVCRQGRSRAAYSPYFDLLPADMMAVITMHKMMGLLMSGGGHGHVHARVVQASIQIGEAVENEIKIHKFFEKTKKKSPASKPEGGSQDEEKAQERLRRKVTSLIKQKKVYKVRRIVKVHDEMKPWGQENQAKVGARLIQMLTETAYIQLPSDKPGDPPDVRPAFIHTFKTFSNDSQKHSRRYGVIECDPLVQKGLEKTAKHMVMPYMPMLVPPQKWTGHDKGAYLFLPSYVMRIHDKEQRQVTKRTPVEQLEHVFMALDTLGRTKWRVNKRVLNVIDRIWAAGGGQANLIEREDVSPPEEPDTDDEAEIKKWKWKVKAVKKENSERHSLRCDTELKLAVARKMQDEEGFYYPHNLDFRGRAYPMHPHLNHLGSDMCRGILEFAEGKPLGQSGLHWLKIHLANLYATGGVDKLSYDDRISFTENHLDDIFDSADRPLEGKRWWLDAEDPFQCLSACINLTEALRSSSPEAYVSHVPVHQDGSCNGLQHYAALGRDQLGAAAVNLMTGDKPADVYSGIAARVLDIMKRDAQKDSTTDPNVLRARVLIDQVDRKLVKQTVMTSVYGVTYIGARDQIKRRLKERSAIEDDNELFAASCYAAKTTLIALGEMFQAARSIMSWLGDCAKIIAAENCTVRWTTPLGLPVVQPYRDLGRHLVKTSLQVLTLQRQTDKVMVKRQRTAFPPNFVHSLDGSHMMMTAIACSKAGLTFAGVHDSYWTHAADVDEMNRILREKFVELYELPILENLLETFQQSFPKLEFPPLPERGDFDLRKVLESPYFFN